MKKQLPTAGITKELAESVFFTKPAKEKVTMTESNRDTKPPSHQATVIPRNHDSEKSQKNQTPTAASNQETKPPKDHNTVIPRYRDTMTPATFETIRKAVKQLGKEAATHRFTEAEKRAIGDIVYTYERQGYRTSENEITRIAIHCLLQDYQQDGGQSILARLLETLHK